MPAKSIKIISKQQTSIYPGKYGEADEGVVDGERTHRRYNDGSHYLWKRHRLFMLICCSRPQALWRTSGESFKASQAWFESFKKRTGIYFIVRQGEAASADMKAAEDYLKTFAVITAAQRYIPQQVFNCDKTGLFGRRCQGGLIKQPRRSGCQVANL